MTQVQWATNSDQRRALPLSSQRLINFYAEQAPKDAKSPVALYGTPGIKTFCPNVGTGPIRGMEVMDGILYVVSGNELWSVKPGCDNAALGSIGVGSDSGTSTIAGITGVTRQPETAFTITGGTSGTISSITIGGVEILPEEGVTWTTDEATTAEQFVAERSPPVYEGFSYAASGNSPRVSSFAKSVPSGWDVGDLMIAQVSSMAADAAGPNPRSLENTFSGPVGWTEVDQRTQSTSVATYQNGEASTDSIWFKFMAEGDLSSYTWTCDESVQIMIAISRISGASRVQGLGPGLFPSALAFRNSDGEEQPGIAAVDAPFAPSITPPSTQSLLLLLMGVLDDGSQSSFYTVDSAYPLQTKEFNRSATMSPQGGLFNTLFCFSEVWAEYKATNTRDIATFSGNYENVWHLSVSSWLTHPDYEFFANSETGGRVVIKRSGSAGGAPEDFNGQEVVITTTGDVTVACG